MIVAVDPGQAGGFAVKQGGSIYCQRMPESEAGVLALIQEYDKAAWLDTGEPVAVIEDQTGCAGKQQSAPSMFKFGRGFGYLVACFQCATWRVELVRPQKWIKALGLGTKAGMTPTQWKNKLKNRAQQLHPGIPVTLKTSDALLLLEYYLTTHRP